MTSVSDKSWWGPRIWRILHILAEFSDRRDCVPVWKHFLQSTANILPCDVCKIHFHQHVQHFRSWEISSSTADFRNYVRNYLWVVHRSVREETSIPETELTDLYGGDREERLREAQALVKEIVTSFTQNNVLNRFQAGFLHPWHRAVISLIHILRLPPAPPPSTARKGRR